MSKESINKLRKEIIKCFQIIQEEQEKEARCEASYERHRERHFALAAQRAWTEWNGTSINAEKLTAQYVEEVIKSCRLPGINIEQARWLWNMTVNQTNEPVYSEQVLGMFIMMQQDFQSLM